MTKSRMEAFSDGMIAIFITIMVLELQPPHGGSLSDLAPLSHTFMSYLLSFLYLAIYWNNHHHLLQAVERVDGRVLWANMHLMFWLSLVPFVTAWMGENHFAEHTVALYGCVLFGAACAYYLLTRALLHNHGKDSALARALGTDFKGKISIGMYVAAIAGAFWCAWIACSLYVAVAVIWLVPDRRFERVLK